MIPTIFQTQNQKKKLEKNFLRLNLLTSIIIDLIWNITIFLNSIKTFLL